MQTEAAKITSASLPEWCTVFRTPWEIEQYTLDGYALIGKKDETDTWYVCLYYLDGGDTGFALGRRLVSLLVSQDLEECLTKLQNKRRTGNWVVLNSPTVITGGVENYQPPRFMANQNRIVWASVAQTNKPRVFRIEKAVIRSPGLCWEEWTLKLKNNQHDVGYMEYRYPLYHQALHHGTRFFHDETGDGQSKTFVSWKSNSPVGTTRKNCVTFYAERYQGLSYPFTRAGEEAIVPVVENTPVERVPGLQALTERIAALECTVRSLSDELPEKYCDQDTLEAELENLRDTTVSQISDVADRVSEIDERLDQGIDVAENEETTERIDRVLEVTVGQAVRKIIDSQNKTVALLFFGYILLQLCVLYLYSLSLAS